MYTILKNLWKISWMVIKWGMWAVEKCQYDEDEKRRRPKGFHNAESSALELFSNQKSLSGMDARMMVLIRCFI
ncbi:hypothetical protein D3Z38_06620 [Clostridiales bacterium]|nr:hypothetical protein [Clostridiales bacterium]